MWQQLLVEPVIADPRPLLPVVAARGDQHGLVRVQLRGSHHVTVGVDDHPALPLLVADQMNATSCVENASIHSCAASTHGSSFGTTRQADRTR